MSSSRSTGLMRSWRVRLGVAGQDRHPALAQDRTGVDPVVDDDDARARLGDPGREGVAHPVGAGELGQVGGVGVDDRRAVGLDDLRGQQLHETRQDHHVRAPTRAAGRAVRRPRPRAVGERGERHHEAGDAVLLGVGEAVGLPVGTDRDDPGRELRVFGGVEKCAEVGSASGDEHDQAEHRPSLPVAASAESRREARQRARGEAQHDADRELERRRQTDRNGVGSDLREPARDRALRPTRRRAGRAAGRRRRRRAR